MGLRGPARKANSEQIKLGDPGRRAKRRVKEEETKVSTAYGADLSDVMRPTMPDYLIKEAIEHWNFIVPRLEAAGIIRAIDADLVADYCQNVGKAIKYERFCKKHGDFIQKTAATKVARPEVKLAREFRKEANKLADKLGLTPKARQAMNINIVAPPSQEEQAENALIDRITKKRK